MARGKEFSLTVRAESIDRELTAAVARAGKGHPCEGPGCRAALTPRAGTRWAGAWRCDDPVTCPDPMPIEISGDIDPAGRDPHRRHRWTRSKPDQTARLDRGDGGPP